MNFSTNKTFRYNRVIIKLDSLLITHKKRANNGLKHIFVDKTLNPINYFQLNLICISIKSKKLVNFAKGMKNELMFVMRKSCLWYIMTIMMRVF